MGRPAYERDAYLRELDTEVVEVGRDGDRPWAVTADTIFYPEGGGQPADRGRMGGVEVLDVRKVDGAVRHLLTRELAPGPVRQVIDWPRRLDHMQQHSGQHLLTVVALQQFGWSTAAATPRPCSSEFNPRPRRPDLTGDVGFKIHNSLCRHRLVLALHGGVQGVAGEGGAFDAHGALADALEELAPL
jgi:Ser-tRNA(Ala) deacylase AlaX